jgi:hypothetical protein
MTPGMPVGGLCAECTALVVARARRVARWVAIGTTIPIAVYVAATLPAGREARVLGAAAVIAWYVLVARIARRLAWEWLT